MEKHQPVRIRIELEAATLLHDYVMQLEQWEDEGGKPLALPLADWQAQEALPVKPGDRFKVIDGHILQDEGRLIYEVTLISESL